MLCPVCWKVLRGQAGRQWLGSYDLHFRHHTDAAALRESADMGCGICRILHNKYLKQLRSEEGTNTTGNGSRFEWLSFLTSWFTRERLSINASLSELYGHPDTYRLEFKLVGGGRTASQTFVLKESNTEEPPRYRTPWAHDTSSNECFDLVREWLNTCSCGSGDKPSSYPKRLIDLSSLKIKASYSDKLDLTSQSRGAPKVRLVETGVNFQPANTRYVTLSHCWGNITNDSFMLRPSTIERFKNGLELDDRMPKTFRDAIEFAARLQGVGYIWIDSLCIMQGSGEEVRQDWLSQSANMYRVYSQAYLNISATAARDSRDGLYSTRKPEHLWEDEINLNVDGIPRMMPATNESDSVISQGSSSKRPLRWLKETSTWLSDQSAEQDIRRCILIDVAFWDNLVHKAPVNRRGWVLQERLMAPRVLHFCQGQIAWECAEFDAAESRPQGVPNFHFESSEVVEESRIKGLDPAVDGRKLREDRLQGWPDPDTHLGNDRFTFELWARVVQVYSSTRITKPTDKLIALAGIAREMSTKFEGKPTYIAGLWSTHLASQLLWKVEPVFQSSGRIRRFENPSVRPTPYRAPSFSWASVDTCTQSGSARGLVYGEITDDVLIEIEDFHIELEDTGNPFGMVSDGHIILWGQLRKIEMHEDTENGKKNGRHYWKLIDRGGDQDNDEKGIEEEEHTNVYLDCPGQDQGIFKNTEDIYCLPAAPGEKTADEEESSYLVCLLLQKVPGHKMGSGTFRRIGLTKLSAWGDKLTRKYIRRIKPRDITLPTYQHGYATSGKHRICLV